LNCVASGAHNHEQVDGLLRSGEAVDLTHQAAIRAAVWISPSARPSGAGRDAAQKRLDDRARVDAERIRESPAQSGHGLDCVDDFFVVGIRVSLDSIDSANDDLVGIESRAAVETEQQIAPDHEVLREALARALCHDFQEGIMAGETSTLKRAPHEGVCQRHRSAAVRHVDSMSLDQANPNSGRLGRSRQGGRR
jgi:hypothetical protein